MSEVTLQLHKASIFNSLAWLRTYIMKSFSFYSSPFHNPKLPKLFSLIVLSYIPFSVSEIINTHITDDSRTLILFQQFGFNTNGHASIYVQQLSWKSNKPNAQLHPPSLGFFLVRASSYPSVINESEHVPDVCVLSSQRIKLVYRFNKLVRDKNAISTYNGSIIIDKPDKYILIFGNCQPEFKLSMKVRTEMYNMDNGAKDYLPVGQTTLPQLYLILFLIYSSFLGVWANICYQHRKNAQKIHLIMGVLLLFLTLKIICASEDKRYIRNTGTPHGWDVAFYIFSFLKGVTLFTVIILIGTGWSFLKPYLQEREKAVVMFVIPLQVLENIASVIIGETGPATKGWFRWNEIFLIIDVMCCCTVIFPIVWSIRSLTEASKTDGKMAKNVEKLTLFKQFYIVVILYLYFTRVVVTIIGAKVNYRYEWFTVAAAEVANLVFYSFIFSNFQPIDKNPYLVIDQVEQETSGAPHMSEVNIFLEEE